MDYRNVSRLPALTARCLQVAGVVMLAASLSSGVWAQQSPSRASSGESRKPAAAAESRPAERGGVSVPAGERDMRPTIRRDKDSPYPADGFPTGRDKQGVHDDARRRDKSEEREDKREDADRPRPGGEAGGVTGTPKGVLPSDRRSDR